MRSGTPASVTLAWLIVMLATGSLGRALDHWQSTLTMIFGSFLAGSSPAGGDTVAFPVFTKVLEVPAPVARTFTLSIQAVGMTAAAAIMLLARRPLEPRVIATGLLAGGAGFVTGLLLLADADTPFWEPTIPASYVKVTFTLTLASVSYIMFVSLRAQGHDHGAPRIPHWNWRVWTGLIVATFLGGVISMLIGTGVNVLLFLFAVTMAGLHPRVGVASSIVTMAGLSVLGLVVLGDRARPARRRAGREWARRGRGRRGGRRRLGGVAQQAGVDPLGEPAMRAGQPPHRARGAPGDAAQARDRVQRGPDRPRRPPPEPLGTARPALVEAGEEAVERRRRCPPEPGDEERDGRQHPADVAAETPQLDPSGAGTKRAERARPHEFTAAATRLGAGSARA